MKIFVHDYDTNKVKEITMNESTELLSSVCEKNFQTIESLVQYFEFEFNKNDERNVEIIKLLSSVDISKCIVIHFDDDYDMIIES